MVEVDIALLLQPFTLQSHIRFADAVQARVASASEILAVHGDTLQYPPRLYMCRIVER